MTSHQELRLNREIHGYRLLERIGSGGFADVYRAEQLVLKRSVALKTLRYEQREEFEARFKLEAEIVARLDHPFIVPIIDYWYDEIEGAFIVMRWINGGTLSSKLGQSDFSVANILRYFDNVTQALEYAHRQGIIHRDIKPSNILIDSEDNAYLADFGIAQDVQRLNERESLSSTVSGTLGFVAPELVLTDAPPTANSDQYSLGIVAYICFAGHHPFPANEARQLFEAIPDLPARLGALAKPLSDVIKRATSRTVDNRYADVREFYAALKAAVADESKTTKVSHQVSTSENDNTTRLNFLPIIGARSARLIEHPDDLPERAEQFFAREAQLEAMSKDLKTYRHILLHGAGGMGKTSLAAEFAQRLLTADDKKPLLWLHVGERSYTSLLDALMKPFELDIAKFEEAALRKIIRETLQAKDIGYIVLDDLWIDGRELRRLMDILPRDIRVICTSRLRYPLGQVLELDALAEKDALALLNYHAAKEDESEAAKALCRLLGYHPLALEIAGKVLLVDQLSPDTLSANLDKQIHRLAAPVNYGREHQQSLEQILETSIQRLSPSSHKVFSAFGAFGLPSASPEFLAACLDMEMDTLNDELLNLNRRSLARIEKHGELESYRVHEYAHSYLRQKSEMDATKLLQAVESYLKDYAGRLDLLELDYQNLLNQAEVASKNNQEVACLNIINSLVVTSAYPQARGYDPVLLELLNKAIEIAKKRLPSERQVLHYLLGKRGDSARDRGQSENALKDYQDALELAKSLSLKDREVVLLCVMSRVHVDNKSYDRAAEILREANSLAEKLNDDKLKGRVLENRGYLAQAIGDMESARDIFAAQLELALKTDDERRKFFAYINYGGANLYLLDYEKAESQMKAALEIALKAKNRVWEGYAHHALGTLYHEKKEAEKAESSLQQALNCFQLSAVQAKIDEVLDFMKKHEYALSNSE